MTKRTFPASIESVPAARAFVADTLAGAPPQLCETAALLTSELVTNAVRHSGARTFTVTLEYDPSQGRLWAGVSETGPGQPVVRYPAVTSEHGRGLRLVGLFADRWGAHRRRATNEKTIWFELSGTPGGEAPPAAAAVTDVERQDTVATAEHR
jgi:anti-sigma regulatory factor (Ser/Thr protein kinase)